MKDLYLRTSAAAASTAYAKGQPPTQAQAKAGNYKKGRALLHGFRIAIETPRNHYREGVAPDGTAWRNLMRADYGHFEKYKGADGDGMDVFLGPVPESRTVWCINQLDPKSRSFDEHKLMMGFLTEDDAKTAYMHSYDRGWKGFGSIVELSVEQLRWWLKFGNNMSPLKPDSLPIVGNDEMNTTVLWDSTANPIGTDIAGVMYGLRCDDAAGELMSPMTEADILAGADSVDMMDALVIPYSKVERKMTQIQNVMGRSAGTVTPLAMQVTPPFKQRGTTNVATIFELSDGQTVTVFLHNPDATPNKLMPGDELVSWKWMLNKKDITILVAPEKGVDLNPREVARRLMKLAEKNSAKFQKANTVRAEKALAAQTASDLIAAKEAELAALETEIAELRPQVEAKRAAIAASDEVADGSVKEFIDAGFTRVQSNDYAKSMMAGGKKLTFNIRVTAAGYGITMTIGFAGGFTGGKTALGVTEDKSVAIGVIDREIARQIKSAENPGGDNAVEIEFVQSVIDGAADLYDPAVTNRLAALAKTAVDGVLVGLLSQAKSAAKTFFMAEFAKKAG